MADRASSGNDWVISHPEHFADARRKLACMGYYSGTPNFDAFDPANLARLRADIEAALTAFQSASRWQRKYSLRISGRCDLATWRALKDEAGIVFSEAFQWELQALTARPGGAPLDPDTVAPAAESDVLRAAHQQKLVGLSLSGGGIRSATFNLGVLQGLASLNLLRSFDYLSTVSGGGYIGSWLSGWLQRAAGDTLKVQAGLQPGTETRPKPREADEIKFLRQYSNYLTPRVGLFSADTWSVIATYLRNTMLNMVILIALLAALMLAPRLAVWLLMRCFEADTLCVNPLAQPPTCVNGGSPAALPWVFLAVGGLSFLVAVFFIALNIALKPHANNRKSKLLCQKQTCVLLSVVLPLIVSGFFISAWLWFERADVSPWLHRPVTASVAAAVYLLVWLGGWGLANATNQRNGLVARGSGWKHELPVHLVATLLAMAFAGAAIGFVLFQSDRFVSTNKFANHVVHLATLGMPVVLAVFGVSMVLLVGLLGKAYSDRSLEWWSRTGGWLMIFIIGWVVVFAVTLYAPPVMAWLQAETQAYTATLSLGWLASTLAGVLLGRSPATGKPGSKPWLEAVVRATPYIFVLGLLVALAVALQALLTPDVAPPPAALVDLSGDWYARLGGQLHKAFLETEATPLRRLAYAGVAFVGLMLVFTWRVDVNKFSLYMMYRNRLVRCYLGASNPARKPQPFTGFDPKDDLNLTDLLARPDHTLQRPHHIVNTALNLVKGDELAWQERKAASFVMTPAYCGFEMPRRPTNTDPALVNGVARGCFRPTAKYAAKPRWGDDDAGVKLGMAMAISGAAVSPAMGYHSSPPLAFLMTLFNVRLGHWCPNPRAEAWERPGPALGIQWLLAELFGLTNANAQYLHLSDGGHFENLGIYELVRRRCRMLLAVDAAADAGLAFDDLGNAIRKCYTDFGIEIELNVQDIVYTDADTRVARAQCAVGRIRYDLVDADAPAGVLLYIKPGLMQGAPADLYNYGRRDKAFPYQPTTDQWFDESQFESYRKLGYKVALNVLTKAVEEARRLDPGDGDFAVDALIEEIRRKWGKDKDTLDTIGTDGTD